MLHTSEIFADSVVLRPHSPAEKWTRSSAASPVASAQSELGGNALTSSAKEQGSSGLATAPKLVKPKKLLIKKSSQ